MMRVDYRYLRLASVPYISRWSCSCWSRPRFDRRGGLARWLKLVGCPPSTRPRSPSWPWSSTWPMVRQARKARPRVLGGDHPFLDDRRCRSSPWSSRSRPGHDGVITLTAFTMFFVAGANLVHLAIMGRAWILASSPSVAGLPARAHPRLGRTLARPVSVPVSTRIQGLLALASAGCSAPASGRAGSRPERLQRLHLRRGRPGVRMVGACRRSGCSCCSPSGFRVALERRTRSARCWRPDHRRLGHSGLHQHRRRRGPGRPSPDHAAVHQCRRLSPHHQLRRGRYPALDLARDRGQGDVNDDRLLIAAGGRPDTSTRPAVARSLSASPEALEPRREGGHLVLEVTLVPAAGIPSPPAARSRRTIEADAHAILESQIRLGLSVPQAAAILAAQALNRPRS